MNWWDAPEWADKRAMVFPDRTGTKQAVIVVAPKREAGDRAQKPNERIRVYVGR